MYIFLVDVLAFFSMKALVVLALVELVKLIAVPSYHSSALHHIEVYLFHALLSLLFIKRFPTRRCGLIDPCPPSPLTWSGPEGA